MNRLYCIFLLIFCLGCYANDPQAADEEADAECAFFTAAMATAPPESIGFNLFLALAVEACTRERYDATCAGNICF